MLLPLTLVMALLAQATPDSSAGIRGVAISDFNGRPIAGVTISVPEVKKSVVTDSVGQFALAGLPAGKRAIRVWYEGRQTPDYVFTLQGQQTTQLAVVLDVDADDLNPLVVEARQANIWRDLAGFYERRQEYQGFAHFFTREDIAHGHPKKISSLLTVEGIVMRCTPSCRPTRLNRGRLCLVSVSVDGVAQREPDFDGIDIADVAGIEVYRGAPPADLSRSQVPATSSSIWMGSGLSAAGWCGLVEIWTR